MKKLTPASAVLSTSEDFNLSGPSELATTLRRASRLLDLPEKSVEPVIARVLTAVLAWLEDHKLITKLDLDRVVSGELRKYSEDLAFIYENRDKII